MGKFGNWSWNAKNTVIETQAVENLLKFTIAKIRKSSRSIQELLPGIEDFLLNVLAKENLSSSAERKRQYYVERLDILKLPPSLPPRPEPPPKTEESSPPKQNGGADDYISQQRELSRTLAANPETIAPQTTYCDVDPSENGTAPPVIPIEHNDEDLYEVPCNAYGDVKPESGNESGTSYETYDEFDDFDDDDLEPNGVVDPGTTARRDTVKLPRAKTMKKKKKKIEAKDVEPDINPYNLPNILILGELYQKGKITWTKRFCVISDGRLFVFKSDKESKPVINFPLLGYDILLLEKEGKRSHVIRISHPGCETHWFGADRKDKTEQWLKALTKASFMLEAEAVRAAQSPGFIKEGSSPVDQGSTAPPLLGSSSTSSLVHESSSECGSGDGVVRDQQGRTEDYSSTAATTTTTTTTTTERSPTSPAVDNMHIIKDPDYSAGKKKNKKKKDLNKQLNEFSSLASNFFGTLGKTKKKRKTLEELEFVDIPDSILNDPDIKCSGYLLVSSTLVHYDEICRRWCVVKNGEFAAYVDHNERQPEFVFPLVGCDLSIMENNINSLAFKVVQGKSTKVVIYAKDTMEQGKWVGILIRETGCAPVTPVTDNTTSRTGSMGSDNGEAGRKAIEDDSLYDVVYEESSSTHDRTKSEGPPLLPRVPPPSRPNPTQDLSATMDDLYDVVCPDDSSGVEEESSMNKYVNVPGFYLDLSELRGESSTDDGGATFREILTTSLSPSLSPAQSHSDLPDSFKSMTWPLKDKGGTKGDFISTATITLNEGHTDETDARGQHLPERDKRDREQNDGRIGMHLGDMDVVHCSLGPSIAQDKVILEGAAENPILSQLRRNRREGVNLRDVEELKQQISSLKQQLLAARRKRARIRERRIEASGTILERRALEEEFKMADKEYTDTNKELQALENRLQEYTNPLSKAHAHGETEREVTGFRNLHSPRGGRRRVMEQLQKWETKGGESSA